MLGWRSWLLHVRPKTAVVLHECSRSTSVVFAQFFQCSLNTTQAELQVSLRNLKISVLFLAQLVHLCLFLGNCCKLLLSLLHVLFQCRRLARSSVNLGGQSIDLTVEF